MNRKPSPVSLENAPIDVQETILALVARYLKSKQNNEGYKTAQLKAGIEETIRRYNLISETVYSAFDLNNPDIPREAVLKSMEEYLQK